jgi:type IV secretion system protein VirB3
MEVERQTLFLALTRPAMMGGVTLDGMVVNSFLTGVMFLGGGSLKYLLVGVVIHFIFRAILKHDHNAFRVLMGWLRTRGKCRNAQFWGGTSVSPLALKRVYDKGDYYGL